MPQLDSCQREAVNRLRNGNILCGEVGSGKSRTGLAYYFCKVCGGRINGTEIGYEEDYVPMKKPIDLYIITTARKRDTMEWEDELLPFQMSVDPERNRYKDKMKVVVDSWNNIKKYMDIRDSFFIFDEQRVVGYGSWSNAFRKIAKNNKWIFLSATPGDVWMDYLSIFIANGFYKNKKDFLNQHVIYNRYSKYPRVDRYVDTRKLEQLRDKILVNIDYVKPTVRHNEVVNVEYDRATYRYLMGERWNFYENKPVDNISELCYLLRKVVNSDISRQKALLDICAEHPKVIVFYNHNYELDILRALPYYDGTTVAEWNGQKHEPIPKTDRWVYLVQYRAGAEGWNCTETDTLIFYSQSYSYKETEQASGRIDRRNTPFQDLYYYKFRSHAPIDMAIYRALVRKKTFNESRFLSH